MISEYKAPGIVEICYGPDMLVPSMDCRYLPRVSPDIPKQWFNKMKGEIHRYYCYEYIYVYHRNYVIITLSLNVQIVCTSTCASSGSKV